MPLFCSRTCGLKTLRLILVLGLSIGGWNRTVRGQPRDVLGLPDLKSIESAFAELAQRVRPSVVAIRTYRNLEAQRGMAGDSVARVTNSHGSGVILRADGTILTNDHVLAEADVIMVQLADGSEYEAQMIQRDLRADMAVIRIQAPSLHAAELGDAENVRVGQWCFAMGNPFGIAYDGGGAAFTHGIVSGQGRNLTPYLDDTDTRYYGDLLQTTADINPGNSGGPLWDIDGRMIGLVTAIVTRTGVTDGRGFAIPLDDRTRRIIDTLAAGQSVRYGYLGVEVRSPRGADGLAGAIISKVSDRDGPAARADLRADDVIVEFDGVTIQSSDQLVRVVGATPVGSQSKVKYVRGGRPAEALVAIAERPSPQDPQPASAGVEIRTMTWRGAILAEMDDATLRAHRVQRAQAGIVVVSLERNAERQLGGLKPGDVILNYNGNRVRTLAEFVEADGREARSIKLDLKGGRSIRMKR